MKQNMKNKMKKQPLVSINIPTFNSEKTLSETLLSVLNQSYKNIEIIIIDGYSEDKTLKIAKNHNVKILMRKGGLLEARIKGIQFSKGKYVLLLDSDQILERTAIQRAVDKMNSFDYLWFYETSYNYKKLLPSLYNADRILTQKYLNEGVVLPRFFKRNILKKAINNIPHQHISICGAQDHIVIDYEVKRLSKSRGMIENAVQHLEPENLIQLFRKQYRWGSTTREFYDKNIYRELITKKNKFRKFYFEHPILSIKSFILRILRGIPYVIGFYYGGRR